MQHITCITKGSIYHNTDIFDNITNDIFEITSNHNLPICLIGDFNARTGNLSDNIPTDNNTCPDIPFSCFSTRNHESTTNLELLDIPLSRHSCDLKTNNNGYKLIELCHNFDLHILNGKFGQDKYIGDFTCDSASGKSTVDYTIMSACLLPNVKDFVIEAFDPF